MFPEPPYQHRVVMPCCRAARSRKYKWMFFSALNKLHSGACRKHWQPVKLFCKFQARMRNQHTPLGVQKAARRELSKMIGRKVITRGYFHINLSHCMDCTSSIYFAKIGRYEITKRAILKIVQTWRYCSWFYKCYSFLINVNKAVIYLRRSTLNYFICGDIHPGRVESASHIKLTTSRTEELQARRSCLSSQETFTQFF